MFVPTKHVFCRNKHNFIMTKVLLQQAYICRNKTSFVVTEICLSQQTFFSQQTRVFVTTNICHNKTFVATKSLLLWQQKTCFVTTNTSMFVMTKLSSLQKLYIWQLPPMIGSSLPVVVCGWVNHTDIKYLVLLVHIRDDKWVLTFPA